MQVYQCCEAIRIAYNQIGSGEQGYVPKAIAAAIRALDAVAGYRPSCVSKPPMLRPTC